MKIKYFLLIQILIYQVKSHYYADLCQELSTYFDSGEGVCKQCSQNCAVCASVDKCIQCQYNYYLNQQGQCIRNCKRNQLKGLINQRCYYPADQNCQNYDYQNYCHDCHDGYILNQNGICKNELCSQSQGVYDTNTNKCSLDEFFISDLSFEQQNISQNIQNQFNFQYSSLKDDLNEQIVEIIILEIQKHKIVIGRTDQYLVFYDYETMSPLQLLDMLAPITQIRADEQQLKLYVLIQHYDQQKSNFQVANYILNTLISVDLVSYEQNVVVQYNDIVDEAFFTQQYLIIRQQNNLIIFLLEDQTTKILKTQNNLTKICFLQKESIVLFEDTTRNFYLTNPLFTMYNKINGIYQEIQGMEQIVKQSLISIMQKDRRGNWLNIFIYEIQKQIDDTNQISYILGKKVISIDDPGMEYYLYTTNKSDLIYLSNDNQEIQIWKEDQMLNSMQMKSKAFQIQDDCIIDLQEKQIIVYLNPEKESEMTIQTYNITFNKNIYLVFYNNNQIFFSAFNTIFTLKYDEQIENKLQLQPFSQSNNQIKIKKKINNTLVYSDNGETVSKLIIFYDNEYLIIGQTEDQQFIFIRESVAFSISQSIILSKNLFIIGQQQLIITNMLNFQKEQISFQKIIKILSENENLYLTNQQNPKQLQLITFTPHEKQECSLNFPTNPLDQSDYDFESIQISSLYLSQLKETSYNQAISNFIINIYKQTLQYMDMSYPFFSYQSVTFHDIIYKVEAVQSSNSILLVRFQNDKQTTILINCKDNTKIYINRKIGNIMYFKSNILFMSYPYNQLLVYQVSNNNINQNIFYQTNSSNVDGNDFQQVVGETYNQTMYVQSLTDGSLKQFNTITSTQKPTNIIQNTNIYITLSYNYYGKSFSVIDVNTDKYANFRQIKYYKLLQNGDNFLIIAVSTTNFWRVIDKSLNFLEDLALSAKEYYPSLLWKEDSNYYYISLSFYKFTIFDMQGNMVSEQNFIASDAIINKGNLILFQADQIAQYSLNVKKNEVTQINSFQISSQYKQFNVDSQNSLLYIQFETKFLALQIDTLKLVQSIEIQIDYIFIGIDTLNRVQIFRQSNTIVLLYLQNDEVKSIALNINLQSKRFFIDSELGILVITENTSNQIFLLTYLVFYEFNSFKIDTSKNDEDDVISLVFNYNYHLSVLMFNFISTVQLVDINYYYYYKTQIIKLAPGNLSTLVGINNEKIVMINNDNKYLTLFDNKSQKLEDSLMLDQKMNFTNIEYYQIVNFSKNNLILCIRKADYYIFYQNIHSIFIMGMKDNLFAQFWKIPETHIEDEFSHALYIKQLALPCSTSLDYESKQFKQEITQYHNFRTVVVSTSSIIDNYKHIILSSQISSNIETLRYQVYYQPPTTINQFPVANSIKSQDFIEIYSAQQGLKNIQEQQLEMSSTKFISSKFKNLKIEILNITLLSDPSFFQFSGIYNLTITNLTITDNTFYKTIFQFNNMTYIKMQNIFIKNNSFQQGILFANQSLNVFIRNIYAIDNKLIYTKSIDNNLNPYLFNFFQTQVVKFNNTEYNCSQDLGFVNFTGLMINFEFFYSMQIINSKFTLTQQKIPIISITYAQSINITNLLAQQTKSFKFILISLVNYLHLANLEFANINESLIKDFNQDLSQNNQISNNKDPSLYSQLDKYILNFGGIDHVELSNLTINFCYNVGMLNLNYFSVGQNTIQNSNLLQASNIKIFNSSSTMKEPAINLGNIQSNIYQLKIDNLNFKSNIMNIYYLQYFNLSQSEFMNIILQNDSTTINNYKTNLLQISDIKFQNITSTEFPAVFLTKQGEKIIIQNCTFKQNKNIIGNSSKLIIDNQSILNVQNQQIFEVSQSYFIENIGFGYGGALYLYQVQKSNFLNTHFIYNQALENSGGAIYSANSVIQLDKCFFKDNISRKERGGAIFSDTTLISIKQTAIILNSAYIGGGIFYNQLNSIEIDKKSQIYSNKGKFYGNNLGSFPKKLLQVNLFTKQVYNKIIIRNFQSGNYTKQPIYVQYFDEQNEMLNFTIAEQTNLFSSSIKEELENYKISVGNITETKNLTIILGQQLEYIKDLNVFQLNITAGNIDTSDFQLFLFSEFSGQKLVLDLLLNFRRCQQGEILYSKQGYISCDKCIEGTYSLVDPNIQSNRFQLQCKKCQNTIIKQCYSDQIILQDNYWREYQHTDVIYKCDMIGCSESALNQKNGCIQGYIGPLCNTCDYKGLYWGASYAQKGKSCYACGKQTSSYIYLAIIILLYSLYIKLSVNSQISSHLLIIQIDYLRKMDILFLSKTKLRGSDTGIILKIFFHYLQIFSSSIDILYQIPDLVGNIFQLGGDPSYMTYTNLDCIYKDWIVSQLWFNRLTTQIAQFDPVIICQTIIFKNVGPISIQYSKLVSFTLQQQFGQYQYL
ncbi:hypothetical protein ABPG74_022488 [Tetrahymena malaccensis]